MIELMRNKFGTRTKTVFHDDINPEDLFLDSAVHNDIAVPHDTKVEDEFPFTRFRLALSVFVLIVIAFTAYTANLNIKDVETYRALAYDNASQVYPISAPRGIIYDRTGKALVENIPSFDLVVTPRSINKFKDTPDALLAALGITDPALAESVRTKWKTVDFESMLEIVLVPNLSHEDALSVQARIKDIPGIRVEVAATRAYAINAALAHALGYTGKVSRDDLRRDNGLAVTDLIGKTGVELVYDEWLRGVNGRRTIEVDARANKRRERVVREVVPGNDLTLSLDEEGQRALSDAFKRAMEELGITGGTGIAMDPNTGEILAMVSFPDFDNNAFTQGRVNEVQAAIKNPANPLFNRAVSGAYLPGSSIKPLLAEAGLAEGVIGPETIMDTNKEIRIVNQYDPSIVYRFRESMTAVNHGRVDLTRALAISSNIFFYALGGGHKDLGIEGLGVSRIAEYFKKFGFGSPLGIDLPGEVGGFVPSPEWKQAVKREGWLLGDTYNLAIGQGYVTVTPLQLTAAIGAIANEGTLYRPRLGVRVVGRDGAVVHTIASEVLRENIMDPENVALVTRGMKEAVKTGTAAMLAEFGGRVAAKTGTAQFNGTLRSWFTSFVPATEGTPGVVLTILMEGGEGGGVSAAPVARDFYTWYFDSYVKRGEPAKTTAGI